MGIHSSVHRGSQRAGEQRKIAKNAYPYKVGPVSLDLLSTDVLNQTWVIRHLVDDEGDYPGAKRIRSYEEDGLDEQGGKAVGYDLENRGVLISNPLRKLQRSLLKTAS